MTSGRAAGAAAVAGGMLKGGTRAAGATPTTMDSAAFAGAGFTGAGAGSAGAGFGATGGNLPTLMSLSPELSSVRPTSMVGLVARGLLGAAAGGGAGGGSADEVPGDTRFVVSFP